MSCLYPVARETLDDQFRLLCRNGQWKIPFLFPSFTLQISNLNRRRSLQKEIDLFIHCDLNGFFCINTVSFYTHQLIILVTPMGKEWCKKWKWFDECHMRGSHHWQVTKSIRNDNDILQPSHRNLVSSHSRWKFGDFIQQTHWHFNQCGVCNLLAKQQISSKCSFHNDVNDCLCFHFHDFVFLMVPHLVNKNASNGTEGS